MKPFVQIIFLGLFITFASCGGKFDKVKWTKEFDGSYPERDKMLDDLLNNQKLNGLRYWQLIDLLGKPEHDKGDSCVYYYQIIVDYGRDIDPVYIKNLELQLN